MQFKRTLLIFATLAIGQVSLQAAGTVINFSGLSQDGGDANVLTPSYSQNGYTFSLLSSTSGTKLVAWQRSSGNHPTGGDSTTSLVPYSAFDVLQIAASDNSAFSIFSIDLAPWGANQGAGGPAAFSVEFTGTRFGGGNVSQTFNVLNSQSGAPALQTFTFTGFSNLAGVSFTQGVYVSGTAIQFNNVVVSGETAPEPASGWLIAGLLLFLPLLRKHAVKGRRAI